MRLRLCDKINGCGTLYRHSLRTCPNCSTPNEYSTDMGYDPRHYIYDIETYPNVFTFSALHCATLTRYRFEISNRRNDGMDLIIFLEYLSTNKSVLIGFNNVGFDYPVIHHIVDLFLPEQGPPAKTIYNKAQSIIDTPWNNRFSNVIWESDRYVEQIDLFMIHHFDNSSRSTSLKALEFAMRAYNIQDLPYPPGTILQPDEIDKLLIYNDFDVDNTFDFYKESIAMIEFREGLSEKYDKSFMNHNDAKIGKDLTILQLGNDLCFNYDDGTKKPNQTPRDSMALCNAIFPYIKFNHPEFERIRLWLSQQVITETKGVFKELFCIVDGLDFHFGTGGLHASVPGQTVYTNHEYVIIDVDVTSYYPSLGIVNKIYPEHLGIEFCGVVENLKAERLKFKKGTLENAAYKLALNAGFGNSNSNFTPFYDPLYTMRVTINGQLLLCMLAEWLMSVNDLKIIQANTDGITFRCRHTDVEQTRNICKQWEKFTLLDLEEVIYDTMWIRDVNNYMALGEDGKLKRKGAYEYEREWHQNHSALIVPKVVEAVLLHGKDVRDYIINHDDIFDFMMFAKAPGGSHLELDGVEIQRRSRYYVSITGGSLIKVSPPTGVMGHFKKNNNTSKQIYEASDNTIHNPDIHTKNKSIHDIRRVSIEAGWLVTDANNMKNANRNTINYEYYITEAKKLIDAVK